MEILDTAAIRAWDQYTIVHEPISSLNLMERAARRCTDWLLEQGYKGSSFSIFCGKGNNGGDGLAIARQLIEHGQQVSVFIIEHGHKGTEDFQANLVRLHSITTSITFISTEDTMQKIPAGNIVIDALFGSGLNKAVSGLEEKLIQHLNQSGNEIISIDIPSGLFADKSTGTFTAIRASHTLSFQCFKKAFLVADNFETVGNLHILDIGLDKNFLTGHFSKDRFVNRESLRLFLKKRNPFSHKGNFGHGVLFAGSKGMMGAATLAAQACLRTGIGKLTAVVPAIGYEIMQISVPEAMCSVSGTDHLQHLSNLTSYSALAIGPGIGKESSHADLLWRVFRDFDKRIILDADALNVIAADHELLNNIPKGSIITPHPGEFDRLFGKSATGFEKIEKAREKANALGIVIVLKGRYSVIATPEGICYFNPTGNAGMAKGGNGDVLTGMLLALCAQGYNSEQACLLGVYLHGLAADLALAKESVESLLPTDSIEKIGEAFRTI